MESKIFSVFISWSKEPAGEIAKKVQYLLGKIFPDPTIKFFVSKAECGGIRGGDKGRNILDVELEQSNFGILILTENNFERPWIMFEAGALSKDSKISKVVPICFKRDKTKIENPIEVFNRVKYDKDDFLESLIYQIEKVRYEKEPSPQQKENLSKSLNDYWEEFQKATDEILSKSPQTDYVNELSNNPIDLMKNGKAYEIIYSERNDQLDELIKQLHENTSKRIVIFGGIPTKIRNAYEKFASWLILNKESKLFLCYENETVAEARTEDLKITQNKNKIEEVKKMRKDIETLLAKEVLNRVHFIEIEKSTSLYIAIDGDTMYFTPALDKRSSETFTFKLKDSPLIGTLLNYMKSRIENLDKNENEIFINELTNNFK